MRPTSGIASIAYGGAYYNIHANKYNNVIYLYGNELDLIDRVMDDMKDYKSTLKAFDATVTINATLNRLGEIAIETEDKQLKRCLRTLQAVCGRFMPRVLKKSVSPGFHRVIL